MSNPIVQYVVVRSDLMKSLSWPVGALIAQACHASTAVMHLFYDHEDTQTYLRDLGSMHKIVLEVKDENELKKIDESKNYKTAEFGKLYDANNAWFAKDGSILKAFEQDY